jgi:hypothetical protein
MEGLIGVAEVKEGRVDIIDLLKLNALLDMKAAMEARELEKSKQGAQ